MTIGSAMRVSATGMTAERFRMDVISTNLANANSVSTPGQEAYRRRSVELRGDQDGVRVTAILSDGSELRKVFEPGNPLADDSGHVFYSNVEPIEEMVNMMGATRAYEANIAAFNAAKGMLQSALTIGKM